MPRQSMQTAIPYGTPPKLLRSNGTPSLQRWVLSIPREIPPDQYAALVRDFCNQQFVSKGMCVDFAIHDKGDGNPHAHVMLTMAGNG